MENLRRTEVTRWQYNGKRVLLPATADILDAYRPGAKNEWVVQEVLDVMRPWTDGRVPPPVETGVFTDTFPEIVVAVPARAERRWAIHRRHCARLPQLSPFVTLVGEAPRTPYFTVHLANTPGRPMVVRAYPGNEIPPLPWMSSAATCGWPMEEVVGFWREHAYVWHEVDVAAGVFTSRAPRWFQ